jgi:hypothetical protein
LTTTLTTPSRRSIAAVVIAVDIGVLLWAVSIGFGSGELRFPAIPVAQLTFLVVQLAFPQLRWSRDHVLGPANLAFVLFGLQLVVIPTIISTGGLYQGQLTSAPADTYVNLAILLQAAGYVSYALGTFLATRARPPRSWLDGDPLLVPLAWCLVAIGLIGIVLRFPSLATVVNYFSGRGDVFDVSSASLPDAAGTFLRPFASYGLIVLWCVRLSRRRRGQRLSIWVDLALILGALAVSATFNYNRAAVVVPVIALVATYSLHARRLRAATIAVMGLLVLVLALQFGNYRMDYVGTLGGSVTREQANLTSGQPSPGELVQLYGNGPQFWAVIISDADRRQFLLGKTIVGSVMLPVPILGKPFRSSSGPAEYNELVYGQSGVADQILAAGAELYWNFGVAGVAAGYLLIGWVVRRMDERSKVTSDPLETYTFCLMGIWIVLALINSISVLAQILVYFLWPAYLTMLVRRRSAPARLQAGDAIP